MFTFFFEFPALFGFYSAQALSLQLSQQQQQQQQKLVKLQRHKKSNFQCPAPLKDYD